MQKYICDICKEKEADKRFEVKLRYLISPFGTKKLDICHECYNKMFVKKGK